ncbi:hypothetical protein [Zeaxanthinibacter enoshimensis]|uniref:Uncharacterized protein n=1 Tax=Zeaxanthinibacter enoshimensis TaxID=392009 RepID=A0A4R6TP96_9FLAO|nr:hypothetical protein [Zeaxanthinibacter enoshimensis]TDQ33414.1 hypothetical protein CLV82_1254 [Zeaxanthinibacter enoshimensis]
MNLILLFSGLLLLGSDTTPHHPINHTSETDDLVETTSFLITNQALVDNGRDNENPWGLERGLSVAEFLEPDLSEINFIEEENEIDLGFDTREYLPENFDPYSAPVDPMSVSYIEDEESDLDPEIDTSLFLPTGFDPYAAYNEPIKITVRGIKCLSGEAAEKKLSSL